MKTIRNQVKYPKELRLPMLLQKGIRTCPMSIVYAAKKNQQKDNKQKLN